MKCFAKIVKDFQVSNIFAKHSILDGSSIDFPVDAGDFSSH